MLKKKFFFLTAKLAGDLPDLATTNVCKVITIILLKEAGE